MNTKKKHYLAVMDENDLFIGFVMGYCNSEARRNAKKKGKPFGYIIKA